MLEICAHRRLQKFADRIARHPTLQRSKLVHDFLTSTEWVSVTNEPNAYQADFQTVARHYHISHPPPDSHTSLIDSLSDTFINAFSRVRKPDARFVEMAEGIERYEEGLSSVDRLVGRSKQRVDGELSAENDPYHAADAQILHKITWTWRLRTRASATSSPASPSR